MLRVALINMPFADWHRPSFALSQLAALIRREYPGEIDIDVYYLNQDFASHIGASKYNEIATSIDHLMTGVGDWIFRKVAFPDEPENSTQYFLRYYREPRWREFRSQILKLREGLEDFCRELIDKYELASADVVGFTTMFAQNVPSIALARIIKALNSKAVIVFGGANCESPMGDVLAKKIGVIDFVFSGPALISFPEFIGCLARGEPEAVHAIRGIRSRRSIGGDDIRAAIGAERNIDDFFEPDYESFLNWLAGQPELMTAQTDETQPILYFETSRGCWWGERSHCTFCGLNGLDMNYRTMAPDVALRQFRWLFGFASWCTRYHCTDNIMPKTYTKQVFPRLEQPPGASIFYEVKLPLSERELAVMAKASVNKVQPGIEALSTETLRLMHKGTTVFQNIQFLKNCNRFDIAPVWNLLIGFPGETEAVYKKYEADIPLIIHLPPPTGVFMVRFDRYSPYFNQASEYQLDLSPMDYYSLIYPFQEQDIRQLAYFFRDKRISPYMEDAVKWIARLNEGVSAWKRAWEAGSDKRPRLCLEQGQHGAWLIRDSRFGSPDRVEPIDDIGKRILQRLSSPASPADLAKDLGIEPAAVSRRLQLFQERKMLFVENDSVLSLVVDNSKSEERLNAT